MRFAVFGVFGGKSFNTDHSSAGRAEDCRVARLSLGRWFDSGWSEFLFLFLMHEYKYKV